MRHAVFKGLLIQSFGLFLVVGCAFSGQLIADHDRSASAEHAGPALSTDKACGVNALLNLKQFAKRRRCCLCRHWRQACGKQTDQANKFFHSGTTFFTDCEVILWARIFWITYLFF
jgi:hypothetical protein